MIETRTNPDGGNIQAYEDAQEVGKIEFELQDGVMTINHTYAYLNGRGIGNLLMTAAIDYAKANGLKIRPVCSYAIAVMKKNPEYGYLLADGVVL